MLHQLIHTLIIVLFSIFGYMSAWFLIAVTIKRNDVADIAWGLGFILAMYVAYSINHNRNIAIYIVLGMVTIWGLRLSSHIALRNIRRTEDYRYKTWRNTWGSWFYLRSFLQIFMLQGFLLFLVSIPLSILTVFSYGGLKPLLVIGTSIWLLGFMTESLADMQLKRFILNPANKGRIMNTGLWKYSRHPNYFGELTQWWAIGLITLGYSYGWLGLIGPLIISFLIIKVSGVPLLEKKYADNKDYQNYKIHTSMLIPLPTKK